jgi:hypothetical protein
MKELASGQRHRVYDMAFASVYPLYVTKVERKGRTVDELNQAIHWLTGYDADELKVALEDRRTLDDFFAKAPAMNPNREKITGVICGVRIEEITEPLMREIRYLDKLVDEIAKGRKMEKVLRV